MNRGGKRNGAGRKPLFKKSSSVTLKIEDSDIERIPGNKNQFIRDAIKEKLCSTPMSS
jgi:hypothetical protein